jgi:hypothetical protein
MSPRRGLWTIGRIDNIPGHEIDTDGDKFYMITAPNRYPTVATRTLMEFLKARIRTG